MYARIRPRFSELSRREIGGKANIYARKVRIPGNSSCLFRAGGEARCRIVHEFSSDSFYTGADAVIFATATANWTGARSARYNKGVWTSRLSLAC